MHKRGGGGGAKCHWRTSLGVVDRVGRRRVGEAAMKTKQHHRLSPLRHHCRKGVCAVRVVSAAAFWGAHTNRFEIIFWLSSAMRALSFSISTWFPAQSHSMHAQHRSDTFPPSSHPRKRAARTPSSLGAHCSCAEPNQRPPATGGNAPLPIQTDLVRRSRSQFLQPLRYPEARYICIGLG